MAGQLSALGISVQEYTTLSVLRARPGLSNAQLARRALLQNQRPDLVLDRKLCEVGEPAIRTDQREVRAEQHLLLEQRVRVADQDLREVLRRPAREVDVNVRLVDRNGQRLLLPGE